MNSKIILKILKDKNLTISFAESITGGGLSSDFTKNPGASDVFSYGVVTYSNEAKTKLLNIDKEIIEKHGAISNEVVKLMALNVRDLSKADIGVSTSGNAGPKALENKNVGKVFIGISIANKLLFYEFNLDGKTREENINKTINMVWELLHKIIIDY